MPNKWISEDSTLMNYEFRFMKAYVAKKLVNNAMNKLSDYEKQGLTLEDFFSINHQIETDDIRATIKFGQTEIMVKAEEKNNNQHLYPNSNRIIIKYNGLCDVLSNYFTEHDILSSPEKFNEIKEKEKLILNEIESHTFKTHIIEAANLLEKVLAVFLKIYPNAKLSRKEHSAILENDNLGQKTLQPSVFSKLLDNIHEGEYIKVGCFSRNNFNFSGHSILFKKNGPDNYSLYDPNHGANFNLNSQTLKQKLEERIQSTGCNEIAFMDNSKHMNKFRKMVQASREQSTTLSH